ncbi:protein zwilch homolog isoform X2 [Palaemon carinicauda]|uniref:protein zwilch homolog isoform X2 n=1 Tax=Palaemon carinicauda TaxID=392227 RepID=UPI0035B63DCA
MGDATMPASLSSSVEKLMTDKNCGKEVIVVADEQLMITRDHCPEILLPVNQHSEIILVQRFSQQNRRLLSVEDEKQANFSENISSTPRPRGKSNSDLDVTGSPLKCPFSLGDGSSELSPVTLVSLPAAKKARVSYSPVSAFKAEIIASKFNMALRKLCNKTSNNIPLWIICDGKDAQGTLFCGLHRTDTEVTRTVISSSGPFNSTDNLPSLDHLQLHLTAGCQSDDIISSVKATYDVLRCEEENENSSVHMTCKWKEIHKILTPPSFDAHTVVLVKVICCDQRSPAYQMFQELSVLQGFVKGLKCGEVSWCVREDSSSVSKDLEAFFTTIKEKAQRQKKVEEDAMVEEKFYNRRQNMDFTDLLWNVLMKCESYNELKSSLRSVFKAIASGHIRPQIHVRTKTKIGIAALGLMRGQSGDPDLSGITPIEMLVDIGMEKIKRDYVNIFQGGDLVLGDELSWFVVNEDQSIEKTMSLLEKLHVGFQVVLLLRTYLHLPQAILKQFASQALKELKLENSSSPYTFTFNVETGKVRQFLNSISPTTWEVSLESNLKKYSKSLIVNFSKDPLLKFESNNNDCEEVFDEGEKDGTEDTEDSYYCCFYNTVKDKTLF